MKFGMKRSSVEKKKQLILKGNTAKKRLGKPRLKGNMVKTSLSKYSHIKTGKKKKKIELQMEIGKVGWVWRWPEYDEIDKLFPVSI